MESRNTVREVAARAMHGAIQQAIEDQGRATDRAWLAVTYVQEAFDSEGLVVVRRGGEPGQRSE